MLTTVAAIGNRDCGDDGVGPEVASRLGSIPGVNIVLTDPSRLMDCISGVDLAILVDACTGMGPPGTVCVLDSIPPALSTVSTHGMSIAGSLELMATLGTGPKTLRVVAVEGANFEVGTEMSADVKAALGRAVDVVRAEIRRYGGCSRRRIHVTGAVQGVGFRPHAYRLAHELGLCGFVFNSPQGVFVEVEGARPSLDSFVRRLSSELPSPGYVAHAEVSELDPAGYLSFEIRHSETGGSASATILPDVAMCEECLREMNDPGNRRFGYAFSNCTRCGPRYSIIRGLPYDRCNTSMAGFAMCRDCEAEYRNPLDRRFHAQPIACPVCGPRLELWDPNGNPLVSPGDAIAAAVDIVRRGEILAVKGIGGFHLMVDARNEEAVLRLRAKKRRYAKPLAVMAPSVQFAQEIANLTPTEIDLLTSPAAPIVLVLGKEGALAESVAPGFARLGLILPYSPLHHLLLAALDMPVVATSGNLSDEPIVTDEIDALRVFAGIADALLVHNRPIERPIDDSVVAVILDREVVIRRARGYAPLPQMADGIPAGLLGVGAHMKGSAALSVSGAVIVGQYVGDLQNSATRHRLAEEAGDLARLYSQPPAHVCHDLHPDYASTRYAESLGLPMSGVQHHVAHAAACVAENGLDEPVLAVVWDGTGYGPDGTIWGGEFFTILGNSVCRVASLRPFRIMGGDSASRDCRRSTLGMLHEMYGESWSACAERWAGRAFCGSDQTLFELRRLHVASAGTLCSSAGRLFDAFASVVGGFDHSRFEADAPMRFEALAQQGLGTHAHGAATPQIVDGFSAMDYAPQMVLDWQPLLGGVLAAILEGQSPAEVARDVHRELAQGIVSVAQRVGIGAVVLTGGCFQNALLYELAVTELSRLGFRPYGHHRIPPNDEGIAFGQVVAVARGWRLHSCA